MFQPGDCVRMSQDRRAERPLELCSVADVIPVTVRNDDRGYRQSPACDVALNICRKTRWGVDDQGLLCIRVDDQIAVRLDWTGGIGNQLEGALHSLFS